MKEKSYQTKYEDEAGEEFVNAVFEEETFWLTQTA